MTFMVNRVAKGWNISGKFPWEVKVGNFGNIPNWKLSMGIMGIKWEFMGIKWEFMATEGNLVERYHHLID